MDCVGNETSLFNCTHDPGTGCEHADDVGVECGEKLDDSDLKIQTLMLKYIILFFIFCYE